MEGRIKISPKVLIGVAAILIVIIGIAAWMNYRNNSPGGDGASIEVCLNGKAVAVYSIDELMELKSVTVHAELKSAKAEDESGQYTGVLLSRLLKESDVAECKTIVLTAGDGYSSAAKASEAKTVLIAYERDGEPLGYYEKGGTGPMRAVFTEDTFGTRSVQYLTKINCKTENGK